MTFANPEPHDGALLTPLFATPGIISPMDDALLTKTIEELDGDRWGPPEFDSHVVLESHRLRSVPIGDLTVEDLRLLLGQGIGTQWLIPLALARLDDDPLAEGDFYPGDLLMIVLGTDATYWSSHPEQLLALWGVRESLTELRDRADRLLSDERWPPFG
jgi:hypothetical protein